MRVELKIRIVPIKLVSHLVVDFFKKFVKIKVYQTWGKVLKIFVTSPAIN